MQETKEEENSDVEYDYSESSDDDSDQGTEIQKKDKNLV